MDPVDAKFYAASFTIEHQGRELSLRGLLSATGITQIFLNVGIPDFWRERLGKRVNVRLDTLEAEGVLLQQQVEHGTFFEIRLPEPPESWKLYVEQRIRAEGVSPGWKRAFPRIPVAKVPDPDLPVPNLCLVRFVGQELFVNVLNFTLGGLRIETVGDHLGEVRVGAVLNFDLLTSTGEIMANLSAEVRNLTVHEGTALGAREVTRSLGLKFLAMDPANERKYRALIRDHCLVMQRRLGEK